MSFTSECKLLGIKFGYKLTFNNYAKKSNALVTVAS